MTNRLRAARERWVESGQSRTVTWMWVRRALLLAGFSLCVAFIALGTISVQARNRTEETAYSDARNEWQRCQDRVESTRIIDNVNAAAVAHARETEQFVIEDGELWHDIMAILLEGSGAASPQLQALNQRVIEHQSRVEAYSEGVEAYADAAAQFVPVNQNECPEKPEEPD